MVPSDADQITAELGVTVWLEVAEPCTVAAHCEVAPVFTVVGLQVTETEVMAGFCGGVCGGVEGCDGDTVEPLPQPAIASAIENTEPVNSGKSGKRC